MGVVIPSVHAVEDNTLRVALIGCGGRGTGAAIDALSVKNGPLKLVAMADVFRNHLDSSYNALKGHSVAGRVNVPEERKFIGFDACQKAMDCLRPGDIAIFTTPLAFRWVHFGYAIQKGLHVFMEKPLTADGPTSRRMLALGKAAAGRNLKVGVGLMSRHNRPMQELAQRIADGEIGEVTLLRGYRMHGPGGGRHFRPFGPAPPVSCSGRFSASTVSSGPAADVSMIFYIHHIDHCCWMKNAWPVKAQGLGARNYRISPEGAPYVDQNFDVYSVEYTFADGARLIMDGRCINGCKQIYSSYAQGTKGNAIISSSGDCGQPSGLFSGLMPDRAKLI